MVGQVGGGLGDDAADHLRESRPLQRTGRDLAIAGPALDPRAPPGSVDGCGHPDRRGRACNRFTTEVAAGPHLLDVGDPLRPGTYLIESGTHPSIQGPMGLYGILVVTTAPAGGTPGRAYPGATAGTAR